MLFRGLNLVRKKFSSEYARAMYEAWRKDPNEVHEDWNLVFSSAPTEGNGEAASNPEFERQRSLALSAYMLIRYYKTRGHELAQLDPLSNPSIIFRTGRLQRVRKGPCQEQPEERS